MNYCRYVTLASRQLKLSDVAWVQRRLKSKKKKAFQTPARSSVDHALEHFDTFYRPIYGKLWPSIRVSLLTTSKYCAVLNNYTDTEHVEAQLKQKGAFDVIENAEKSVEASGHFETPDNSIEGFIKSAHKNMMEKYASSDETDSFSKERSHSDNQCLTVTGATLDKLTDENLEPVKKKYYDDRTDLDYLNLQNFIPAKRVVSELESLRLEAAEQNILKPLGADVNIVKQNKLNLPQNLKVLSFPQGNTTSFPPPKPSKAGNLIGYYLMDAASILPVVALDLQQGDSVLDLCAAPGGKTLSILQTMLPGQVICNDSSYSRMKRLKDVLRFYLPPMDNVSCSNKNGVGFVIEEVDKVLVDVPCYTDRHVLQENGSDLFRPGRMRERMALPALQKDLLMSGIKACKPGGSVVYSTCTMSPVQNDGVIDMAFKQIYETTDIKLEVENLHSVVWHFRNIFSFSDSCRYGQLVLPRLSSNFGPMYFCKINRLV